MKQDKPLVTVAIPCGDGERYIGESIRSVLSQTYRNLEIVVLDQRSEDRTLEIARSFDDPRVAIRQNPVKLTIGANWNQGLRYGSGTYIIIHHQDDVMGRDSIERKVLFLENHPAAGFVFSRVEIIDGDGKKLPNQREWFSNDIFKDDQVFDSMRFFIALLLGKNLICCPSVMMRRDVILKLGEFDESLPFSLDWEMWLRMAAAFPVGYVDSVTTFYRWHSQMESMKHLEQELEHNFSARISAIRRSAEYIDRWGMVNVLSEIVTHIRSIESKATQMCGLASIPTPLTELTRLVTSNERLKALLEGKGGPAEQLLIVCQELMRMDKLYSDACRRNREFEDSASFKLGWFLLWPVRIIRKMFRA